MTDRYLLVEQWEEADLLGLPTEETDYYEYKSSKVPTAKLKRKSGLLHLLFGTQEEESSSRGLTIRGE